MLWRLRAALEDRPGSLADLANACGKSGVNIKAMQVFPGGATVTDELVLQVPKDWDADSLRILVESAGGVLVSATPVQHAALDDQPTRYVQAARAILERPATFPEIAAQLFDADVAPGSPQADVLEMIVGGSATIQIRRDTPFTPTERARAEALAGLVGQVLDTQHAPAPQGATAGGPDYVADGTTVTALVSGLVVGRATVEQPADGEPWPVDLWVDPAWLRRGIGTRLLADGARLARRSGADEIVLTAPSDTQAVLPMVLAAGMRGRIRMAGDTLTVRITITDLRA